MNEQESRAYTVRYAVGHLAALEEHFKNMSEVASEQRLGACNDCVGKHLPNLLVLADEGQGFFQTDREVWFGLGAWVHKTMDLLIARSPSNEDLKRIGDESRSTRKDLEARYFGRLGQCSSDGKGKCDRGKKRACSCDTGNEPCCERQTLGTVTNNAWPAVDDEDYGEPER